MRNQNRIQIMNKPPHKKQGGNHDKREKIFVFGHNHLFFKGFVFNFINKFDKTIKIDLKTNLV